MVGFQVRVVEEKRMGWQENVGGGREINMEESHNRGPRLQMTYPCEQSYRASFSQ